MKGERRLPPGERRHGFVVPVPHTRSARKALQMYLKAVRPMVHEIAAALDVTDGIFEPGVAPQRIGAEYLRAFMDDLSARLDQA